MAVREARTKTEISARRPDEWTALNIGSTTLELLVVAVIAAPAAGLVAPRLARRPDLNVEYRADRVVGLRERMRFRAKETGKPIEAAPASFV